MLLLATLYTANVCQPAWNLCSDHTSLCAVACVFKCGVGGDATEGYRDVTEGCDCLKTLCLFV